MTDTIENLVINLNGDAENSLITDLKNEDLKFENININESKISNIEVSEKNVEEVEQNKIQEINHTNDQFEISESTDLDLCVPKSNNLLPKDLIVGESNLTNTNVKKTINGFICEICSQKVYPMEKAVLDSKTYHKNCFRCCKCKKSLSVTVVTKFNDNLFCKPHYLEMFRKRGKYDDIKTISCQPDSANNSYNTDFVISNSNSYSATNYSSSNNASDENKETVVKAKDLAKRFQYSQDNDPKSTKRKEPIDIGIKRSVSSVTQSWIDRQKGVQKCNSNNNFINEFNNINQTSNGFVKNRRALFESKD